MNWRCRFGRHRWIRRSLFYQWVECERCGRSVPMASVRWWEWTDD